MEKIIHQIWVGDKRIPSHIKKYMQDIQSSSDNFVYYLWTDENIPHLPKNLQTIYDSYNEFAIKADLLRLWVVYNYGGMYLDADFEMINKLDDLLSNDGFIVYNGSYGVSAIANSIFGFKKESPILKHLIDNILHPQQFIGPNWWAQKIYEYLGEDINDITLSRLENRLLEESVELRIWKDVEQNYLVHKPLASWIPNSTWEIKFRTGDYD
jgi:mannosyltransferase OCH1-like enzyme